MLERKIAFLHMAHSDALEAHANQRIDKIEKLLEGSGLPQSVEVHLKCQPHGKFHEVDVHLISKDIKTNASASNAEMYLALDEAIERVIETIKRQRGKQLDSEHKPHTAKTDFYKD